MDVVAIEREMDEVISDSYDFTDILNSINRIPGDTMEAKLTTLNQCNCCDRHQMDKPSTYVSWCDTENNMTMWYDYIIQCDCNCRHMARWICRTCTDDSSPTQSTMENKWTDTTTTGITEDNI